MRAISENKKTAQSKQSPIGRKIDQSGHPEYGAPWKEHLLAESIFSSFHLYSSA
jgi:hypothetical protein